MITLAFSIQNGVASDKVGFRNATLRFRSPCSGFAEDGVVSQFPLAFDNADRVPADDSVDADERLQANAEPGFGPLQIADGVCWFGELDDLLQRLLITFLRPRPAGYDDEEAVRVSVKQV